MECGHLQTAAEIFSGKEKKGICKYHKVEDESHQYHVPYDGIHPIDAIVSQVDKGENYHKSGEKKGANDGVDSVQGEAKMPLRDQVAWHQVAIEEIGGDKYHRE